MQQPNPRASTPTAQVRRVWWHGLVALVLGLISIPSLTFGLFTAMTGYMGLILLTGAVAFAGVVIGAYGLVTNNLAGRVMGGLGLLLSGWALWTFFATMVV